MTHDELRKFSIENKKFYYDLHGKISKLCYAILVVTGAGRRPPPAGPGRRRGAPGRRWLDTGVARDLPSLTRTVPNGDWHVAR